MFAPGKIMLCGGGPSSGATSASTWVLDLSSYDPSSPPDWLAAANMNKLRRNHNLVLLPDGRILAVGGESIVDNVSVPEFQPEMFDPASNTWTLQPAMSSSVSRAYHSTAILLPDGRVAVGGGVLNSFTGQIFQPHYIVEALARPIIVGAPNSMPCDGGPYEVQYLLNGGLPVTSACLIRLGSVTHGFDQDQRRVPLTIAASSTISGDLRQIIIKSPENTNIAPPGFYMLFIMYDYKLNYGAPCELAAYVKITA
jgi:hypothetical protein